MGQRTQKEVYERTNANKPRGVKRRAGARENRYAVGEKREHDKSEKRSGDVRFTANSSLTENSGKKVRSWTQERYSRPEKGGA